MSKRKKPNSRLSNRSHVLVTLAIFLVGGLVASCMTMAYAFVAYPNLHSSRPGVAGAIDVQWSQAVRRANSAPAPVVNAPSGILVDIASGTVLWQRDATTVRPLASITKLVTASAYLATQPDLTGSFRIPADFNTEGITDVVEPGTGVSKLDVVTGERLTNRDLLAASLISSANNAVLALARTAKLTPAQLQTYAVTHGARSVRIVEPSGLEPGNVGSAQDVAVLANVAFQNATIAQLAGRQSYHITTGAGRGFSVRTTNALIGQTDYDIVAGKTGYLTDVGFNFVVQARQDGHDLLLVLLASPTSDDRFIDADAMLQWAFANHAWQTMHQGAMLPL